jgi:hypothetical protein
MPRPDAGSPTPWALLWFGGMAACAWVPLLLSERSLPVHSPAHRSHRESAIAGYQATQTHPFSRKFPILSHQHDDSAGRSTLQSLAAHNPKERLDGISRQEGPIPHDAGFHLHPGGAPQPDPSAWLQEISAPPGSILLGGPLGLESLQEKAMVPAARTERALRIINADRLSAVPSHWRAAMQTLVKGSHHVLPAEIVRLPSPRITAAEEYPMVVKSDGIAETIVTPSPDSKQDLERWAERQAPVPAGSLRPVMVILEPIKTEIQINTLEQDKNRNE